MQHSGQHLAELTPWIRWAVVLILEITSLAKEEICLKQKLHVWLTIDYITHYLFKKWRLLYAKEFLILLKVLLSSVLAILPAGHSPLTTRRQIPSHVSLHFFWHKWDIGRMKYQELVYLRCCQLLFLYKWLLNLDRFSAFLPTFKSWFAAVFVYTAH